MMLPELRLRGLAEAKRCRLTMEGLLGEYRIKDRSISKTIASGGSIDTATAIRLLPLVERLLLPGEVGALELPSVAICPAALIAELAALRHEAAQLRAENAALRASAFHHQPN